MLRNPIFQTLKAFSIGQCVALYQVDGVPYIDIITPNGRFYEGCTFVNLGGGGREVRAYPSVGVEVIASIDGNGPPYIVGVLEDPEAYKVVDKPILNTAGEYSNLSVGLKDVSMIAGATRLICSDSEEAVYVSPRLRVQGKLEISSGGPPDKSLAVAEPLISYLDQIQAEQQSLLDVVKIVGPYIETLLTAAQNPQAVELGLALSNLPDTITEAYDTIKSSLAKIER